MFGSGAQLVLTLIVHFKVIVRWFRRGGALPKWVRLVILKPKCGEGLWNAGR